MKKCETLIVHWVDIESYIFKDTECCVYIFIKVLKQRLKFTDTMLSLLNWINSEVLSIQA